MVVKVVFLLSILRQDLMDAKQLQLETRGAEKTAVEDYKPDKYCCHREKTNGRSCTELIMRGVFYDWEDVHWKKHYPTWAFNKTTKSCEESACTPRVGENKGISCNHFDSIEECEACLKY